MSLIKFTDVEIYAYKIALSCCMDKHMIHVQDPTFDNFVISYWSLLISQKVYSERIITEVWDSVSAGRVKDDAPFSRFGDLRVAHRDYWSPPPAEGSVATSQDFVTCATHLTENEE